MAKVLLIGEAPNEATRDHPDLWLLPDGTDAPMTHTANRLLRYTGYTMREYVYTFERTNLFDRPMPVRLPRAEARERALALESRHGHGGRRIVLLGSRVAEAFRFSGAEPLAWHGAVSVGGHGYWFALVPHPSGRNLWWNHAEHRAAARDFFRQLLRIQWGDEA